MTEAVLSLTEAIRELEKASTAYTKAVRETGDRSNALYISIVGDAWDNYAKAGGSKSMINPQLPRELDYKGSY